MASRMRSVRRRFREEVLRSISSGHGHTEELIQAAGRLFGRNVGYEVLIKTFLASEASNATSQLRIDGLVESVGKQWKPIGGLNPEDVDTILIRRKKRIRGMLKSQVRLAHQNGRIEEATEASEILAALGESDDSPVSAPAASVA